MTPGVKVVQYHSAVPTPKATLLYLLRSQRSSSRTPNGHPSTTTTTTTTRLPRPSTPLFPRQLRIVQAAGITQRPRAIRPASPLRRLRALTAVTPPGRGGAAATFLRFAVGEAAFHVVRVGAAVRGGVVDVGGKVVAGRRGGGRGVGGELDFAALLLGLLLLLVGELLFVGGLLGHDEVANAHEVVGDVMGFGDHVVDF